MFLFLFLFRGVVFRWGWSWFFLLCFALSLLCWVVDLGHVVRSLGCGILLLGPLRQGDLDALSGVLEGRFLNYGGVRLLVYIYLLVRECSLQPYTPIFSFVPFVEVLRARWSLLYMVSVAGTNFFIAVKTASSGVRIAGILDEVTERCVENGKDIGSCAVAGNGKIIGQWLDCLYLCPIAVICQEYGWSLALPKALAFFRVLIVVFHVLCNSLNNFPTM